MVWQRREWVLPWPLIPLICLIVTFLVSLSGAAMPVIGIVEVGTFAIGLLFCVLVANLSHESDEFTKWVFKWLQIIGSIVAILCLYQYLHRVLTGPSNEVLIPYLLPPGGRRVNGVYGQPNLTALLLLVTIVAFLQSYVSKKYPKNAIGEIRRDVVFFFVSTSFFLTGSRAGYLSLLVVLAVLFWLISRGKFVFPSTRIIKSLSILFAGFVFTLLPLSPEIVSPLYTRPDINVDSRFLFWAVSILIFFDFPLFGIGLDHFKLFLPSYARKAHDALGFVDYETMGYTDWSHNEYLQILAESGMVGFLFLTIFLVMLIRIMYKEFHQKSPDTERSFLFLLILPFFIQAMFEWPLRHPAILFIFFLILGIILAKGSSFRFHLGPLAGFLVGIILAASIAGIAFSSVKEYRFTQLKKEARENGCGSDYILNSMNDPYLEFKMLGEVLPLCIADEAALKDRSLMEKLQPYYMKISNLQGTYSQWYNLGVVNRSLDDYALAEHAFQQAVERQPEFEQGWAALHGLHIEEAVRQTGRPIEDFLPPDKKSSADYHDSLFKRQ
jgi:O-antigen ligase